MAALPDPAGAPARTGRGGAVAAVEEALSGESRPWASPASVSADSPPEHPAISFLRRYSNYLTPKLGLFSGDALAAISTYLRNFQLNLLILIAFFSLLLCLPYVLLHFSRLMIDPGSLPVLTTPLGDSGISLIHGLAIVCLTVAVCVCALKLTQLPRRDRFETASTLLVVAAVIVPALASAWLLTVSLLVPGGARDYPLLHWVLGSALAYFLPWLFVFWMKMDGYNIEWIALQKLRAVIGALGDPKRSAAARQDLVNWTVILWRFVWQVPWTLLAGGLGGLFCYVLAEAAAGLPAAGAVSTPPPSARRWYS